MGAGDGAIFTRGRAEVNGLTIQYFQGGTARDVEPVLYLHGLRGGEKWESFHMALGTVTQTVAPMLPGLNTGEPPKAITSIEDYAGYILALMDVTGLDRPVLVGHSFGGWIAQYMVTRHPERFSRLILIDPMGLDVPEAPAADLGALDEEAFARLAFGKLGMVATANPYGFGAEWESVRSGQEFERQWKGRNLVGRLASGPAADPALTSAMRSVRLPTLLLWGRLDGIVPLRHGELLHEWLPGSRLEVIERAGHLPMVERPETVNRLVRNFLVGVQEAIPEVVTRT
jgi:pimeloyl-ACP methyl ester carboxylesterase